MNTPPWIRSAIDNGLAAARLESQAGGRALPHEHADDTNRKHDPADKNGSEGVGQALEQDRKSTRLNSSHQPQSRMPSSA